MPAKQPCDRFVAHLFLSNNRCRDCDFPESEHIYVQANGRGRAPTLEQKIDLAVKDALCTVYTPHAWLVDKCRDCGRPESEHETTAVAPIAVEEDNKKGRVVKIGKFRKEEEIAASLGINSKNSSRRGSGHGPSSQPASSNGLQIRGKGAVHGLRTAQKVMDQAVDQMVLMNQELEDARQVESESLQANSISQEQYDAKMAEIQAAFAEKEAELRAQVEQAKQQMQESEAQLRTEQQQQRSETPRRESNTAQQQSAELERIRAEAEQARAEATALRAEAAQAQEAVAAAQDKAAQERDQLERQRQAEIEAARLEAQAARQEAEALKAEAAAQREQIERERQRQQEETAAAIAAAASAAAVKQQKTTEEEKEQTPVSVPASVVVPVAASTVITPATASASTTATTTSSSTDDDEEEAQPTIASTNETSGPYAGTVNLNDVLLKVEKLFLSGKNYFRFCYSKSAVVISSVFLRVINDEYVLCWSKSNARTVHQSRTLPFSSIRSIVIGKQSSVFQRHEFEEAAATQCFSILGEQHSLHLMAANERDAEMTAFGLASLMKESRLTVSVYDFNQYREPENALLQQTQQEQTEEEDGSPTASTLDVDQLSSHQAVASSAPKFLLQFSVKCTNLPLTNFNTIVCLVDRDEKTDRLMYVSQTEKIQRTHSPEFVKQFELEYERNVSNLIPKQIRFNVYDVNTKSTQIEDADRVGSVRVDVNELVDFEGVDFVYLLSHKDHAKNHKLLTNRSLITVRITKKSLLKRHSVSGVHSFDATELTHLQSVLQSGDIFTSYTEHQPSYPLTLFYRVQPNVEYKTQQLAEQNFLLGNLYYTIHNNEESGSNSARGKQGQQKALAAKTEVLPLRTICDVYVGKKHRSFGPNAKDDCCLSLLSKTGVRLDLEAKNKIQRDEFVNAITGLLKHASNEAKKRATAKLGIAK